MDTTGILVIAAVCVAVVTVLVGVCLCWRRRCCCWSEGNHIVTFGQVSQRQTPNYHVVRENRGNHIQTFGQSSQRQTPNYHVVRQNRAPHQSVYTIEDESLKSQALRRVKENQPLDLHGFRVKEAIGVLKQALKIRKSAGKHSLNVITGKGLHSKNNIPRIKPAVEEYLHELGYEFAEARDNQGMLNVKWN